MQIAFLILLFITGACTGSFLCCSARRLQYRETQHSSLGRRSVCLSCHYQLKWYDNIPIISWLLLKGKCRKCHKKIGSAELLSEIGSSLAFLALGSTINLETANITDWINFFLILALIAVLIFLAIYDGLFGELPTAFLTLAIILGFTVLAFKEYSLITLSHSTYDLIWQPTLAVLILGGLY